MNLTLEQLFGSGSIQDELTLRIQKTSLTGLTPSLENTAESLLVGILLRARVNFEGEFNFTDSNNNPITYSNTELFELLKIFRWNGYFVQSSNGEILIRDSIIIELFQNYAQPD